MPSRTTRTRSPSPRATSDILGAPTGAMLPTSTPTDGKMSKSKGEFLTVSLLEQKGYDPLAYRFFCLQSHYRKSLVFTWENLDNAALAYQQAPCQDRRAQADGRRRGRGRGAPSTSAKFSQGDGQRPEHLHGRHRALRRAQGQDERRDEARVIARRLDERPEP